MPSNEVSAMSHPVEAPESMLFEPVLCRFACPLVMENTMKYLVDALRVVALAGVKLCSPAVELSPLRSTTLVPGASPAVLVWRAKRRGSGLRIPGIDHYFHKRVPARVASRLELLCTR